MTAPADSTGPNSQDWRPTWQAQVARDSGLHVTAYRVASLLAYGADLATRDAILAQRPMAKALSCHVDTVARAVHELANKGHLLVRRTGAGCKNPSRYVLIVKREECPHDCGDFQTTKRTTA
jgi:hypothetical protein